MIPFLLRSAFATPTFAIIYSATFTLTGYNIIKNAETNEKYPARKVEYWHGSCPPGYFEYRSKKK
jgi:hypothetical protein